MSSIPLLLPIVFTNPTEINLLIPFNMQKRNILVKNLKGVQMILKSYVFSEGENSFNNPFDIAHRFNDFFVNTGDELANKIPLCPVTGFHSRTFFRLSLISSLLISKK